VITYYKSRYLSPPMVYVQQDECWNSYAPAGIVRESLGRLPDFILQGVEEVPLEQVEDLIRGYTVTAERMGVERGLPPAVSGIGGWLVLPVISLVFTCLASIVYILIESIPLLRSWDILTSPGSASYNPFFGPYIGFTTFVHAFLFVMPIFLLALMSKKKRVLPQIIIYFYAITLFVTLANFVALATFLNQVLVDRGFPAEAASYLTQGMVNVILQGVGLCGIWIPYFMYSKRVGNTFVEPWNAGRIARAEHSHRSAALAALAAQSRGENATAETQPVPVVAPFPTESAPMAATAEKRKSRILLIPVAAVLVIVVAVVAGIGGWRLANPPAAANQVTTNVDSSGNEIKHYSNADEKFALDYPADWALQAGTAPTSTGRSRFQMMVFDRSGHKIGAIAYDGVAVMTVVLPAPMSAAAISETRKTVEAKFQSDAAAGVKIIQPSSEVTINGVPGFTMTCSEPASGGQTLVYPLYWLFKGDRTYYLALQSVGQPSAELQQQEEAILQSFTTTQ
jgi:hypothetical protein